MTTLTPKEALEKIFAESEEYPINDIAEAAIPVAELHEQKAKLLPMVLCLLSPDRINFLKGELKQKPLLLDALLTQLEVLK